MLGTCWKWTREMHRSSNVWLVKWKCTSDANWVSIIWSIHCARLISIENRVVNDETECHVSNIFQKKMSKLYEHYTRCNSRRLFNSSIELVSFGLFLVQEKQIVSNMIEHNRSHSSKFCNCCWRTTQNTRCKHETFKEAVTRKLTSVQACVQPNHI